MRSSTWQIRSPCTIWLPIEFHGFTSRINSKGYHSLVPGLISILLETVWVPLKYCFSNDSALETYDCLRLRLENFEQTQKKFAIASLGILCWRKSSLSVYWLICEPLTFVSFLFLKVLFYLTQINKGQSILALLLLFLCRVFHFSDIHIIVTKHSSVIS